MLQHLLDGLTALGNAQALAYLFAGSLIGVFVGVIPGLSGVVILSIILSFVFHISLSGAICLFLAVHAASYFSASVTSILLNTPAHPEAFAVTFDGFPMAQRGEAGRALGISATSTCIGGFIGCAVLVGFIQIINYLPRVFHPPEYVALILLALLLVGTLGTDAASKAIISAGIGLLISSIGGDPITGVFRYTFGAVGLYGGVDLVALALGLFAIPQMILIFGTASTVARQDMMGNEIDAASPIALQKGFGRQVIQGITESLHHWVALIRAGLIGVVCGIIPGIGGFAANFLSYGIAQNISKHRELFGTGIPEGIIAPEGSSLSKEAGGMVPIIGLGIPGSVGGAIFLAALSIKGVKVGYGFAQQYPSLPYEMMWVIALSGLIGTVAGLLAAPFLARVTRVPGPLLVPIIMALSIVGPFVAEISFFAVMEVAVFTVVGLFLRRLRYSLASFAIGLVLGPTLEQNIYLTHTVYSGVSFLEQPLADVLFLITIAILIAKSIQLRRDAKRKNPPIDVQDPILRVEELRRRQFQQHPYPLLGVIATACISGLAIFAAIYGGLTYNFTTGLMPVAAGTVAGLGALWRLPFEIAAYLSYRRAKKDPLTLRASVLTPQVVMAATEPISATVQQPQHVTAAIQEKQWGRYGQYTREMVAFAWFCVGVALCYVFGFVWGIPAFVLMYGLTSIRRVLPLWYWRISFAVLSSAAMWGATYEMISLLHLKFAPIIKL